MSKKFVSADMRRRVQFLVRAHVETLAREIAEEMAGAILGKMKESDEGAPVDETLTMPFYDPRTKRWFCPHCSDFSDLRRRAVTTHMRSCLRLAIARASVEEKAPVQKLHRARRAARALPAQVRAP